MATPFKLAIPPAPDSPPSRGGRKPPKSVRTSGADIGEYDPDESFPRFELGRGVSAGLEWMTPALAEVALATLNAERQRRLKPRHAQAMMVDLRAGRWRLNGEPIIFDSEGKLIDGQHRLVMVVESGMPILTLVVRGIDPAAFTTIDGGAKRTGGDALRSAGFVNASSLAAAAILVYKHETGNIRAGVSVSPSTIEEVVARHPGLPASVIEARASTRILHGAGAGAFCHYHFSRKDTALAEAFFRKLVTGEELHKGDPVLALRNLLREMRFGPADLAHRVIKAWNATRQRRSLSIIKVSPGETFPEIL
jgi:hypothetical protein